MAVYQLLLEMPTHH